jgi:hypothetical protein
LDGTLEVRAPGAGADHLAAREDNRVEVAALAHQRARHGFIEKGEALVDPSLLYEARPDLRQGAEFEIEIA